jgi:putative hydrolase of the HAD superfamily
VIFDAVGTLLTPAEPVVATYASFAGQPVSPMAFREAFRRQEAIDAANGWRVDEARERQRWETIVREIVPSADEGIFNRLWQHFATPAAWRIDPETADLAADLRHRGLVVAVASNFDARLHLVLAGLGWPSGPVLVSSEISYRKPAAAFYHAVAEAVNVPPAEVLMIGDDLTNDYDGARAAGLAAVLYDPAQRHPECRQRITHFAESLAWL